MNGGSLGLRSASCGSLPQYLQQQQLVPPPPPPPAAAVPVRKPGKASLGGSREKERLLPRIFKIAGRRKVGMLLLAVVSVGVFAMIFYASRRGEEIPEGPEAGWHPSLLAFDGIQKPPRTITKLPLDLEAKEFSVTVGTNMVNGTLQLNDVKEFQQCPVFNLSLFPKRHPCDHFSNPPLPFDRKRTGPRPCDVCYLPVGHAMALMPSSPSESPILKNLSYFSEENSHANESNGASIFGGHPSLQQRTNSFNVQESMTIHCGFFKGTRPGIGSGFDIDEMDVNEMNRCHGVVVASAVFGNYDIIQQPRNISQLTKRCTCFYMFVDEETESYLRDSRVLDSTKKVGLWRVVVIHNLPFTDPRRNGKVPKLLLHRLFPNARFSLWIDGKLELVVDPYQILERFLWRQNATFAISRHYRRFDVFVEAEANKAAGKYDNASIDSQIKFYKNEGLTPYSKSKLPITSDVPEGCVIIREHIPITNLFSCLWFNEVDRFTSRDQLSFSTVRDKIMSKVNWSIEMFLDCERRNFVIQAYHRDVLEEIKKRSTPPFSILPTHPQVSIPKPLPRRGSPQIVSENEVRTPLLQEAASGRDSTPPPKKMFGRHGRNGKNVGSRHMHSKHKRRDAISL